jgi:hypothetical protein
MAVTWVVGDRLTVRLEGADRILRRQLEREFDPYSPGSTSEAANMLIQQAPQGPSPRFIDIQNPAGDGLVSATDGEGIYVVYRRAWCQVDVRAGERPSHFVCGPGFALTRFFSSLVRPALQLALLGLGGAAVHSAAVETGGTGVVVAGWSESGKTETALALMETGARFVSDKWTILGEDGTLACFPIGVGVRRWVLPYLPRLRAALPRSARAQLLAAGAAGRITRPLRGAPAPGKALTLAGDAAERAVGLADRAGLRPSELIEAYGQGPNGAPRASLGLLVLLRTVPGPAVSAREVDGEWAAPRLARSAAFERRRLFELYQRVRFAMPEHEQVDMETTTEREQVFLSRVLSGARAIQVDAPFPVDPRRVAEAIGAWL